MFQNTLDMKTYTHTNTPHLTPSCRVALLIIQRKQCCSLVVGQHFPREMREFAGFFFVSRDHGILLFVCGLNKAAVVQCMGWAVQSAKPSAGRDYVYVTLKLFSYANLQKIIAAWRTVGENFRKIPSILWSVRIQKVWPTDATRSFCVNVVFFLAEDLKSLSKFVELGTICLVLIYCKLLQGLTYFWARF